MPHIHSWPGAVYPANEVRFFVPLLQLGALLYSSAVAANE